MGTNMGLDGIWGRTRVRWVLPQPRNFFFFFLFFFCSRRDPLYTIGLAFVTSCLFILYPTKNRRARHRIELWFLLLHSCHCYPGTTFASSCEIPQYQTCSIVRCIWCCQSKRCFLIHATITAAILKGTTDSAASAVTHVWGSPSASHWYVPCTPARVAYSFEELILSKRTWTKWPHVLTIRFSCWFAWHPLRCWSLYNERGSFTYPCAR